MKRLSERYGKSCDVSSDGMQFLLAQEWPGNIRELGAVMDRAAILGGGRTLDVATALGLSRQQAVVPAIHADATMYEVIPETIPLGEARLPIAGDIVPLATAMRQHIERALGATRGRIEGHRGAAAILQINPHTLRARMRKLGIDASRYRD